jgi:hypothetical protein
VNREIHEEELQQVVFNILQRCCSSSTSNAIYYDKKQIHNFKDLNPKDLSSEGACLRLIEGIVQTRTVGQIRKDVAQSNGELPLIIGPNFLCSSELMSLLIRGNADGNFGAISQSTGKVIPDEVWGKNCGYGMLTLPAAASGDAAVPQANALMFPSHPIWVIHGGDHFTVLAKACDNKDKLFWHFNGLPPSGPSSTLLLIEASQDAQRVTDNDEKKTIKPFTYVKPFPGEIDEIVQANAEDKRIFKNNLKKWRIEVVLAMD